MSRLVGGSSGQPSTTRTFTGTRAQSRCHHPPSRCGAADTYLGGLSINFATHQTRHSSQREGMINIFMDLLASDQIWLNEIAIIHNVTNILVAAPTFTSIVTRPYFQFCHANGTCIRDRSLATCT